MAGVIGLTLIVTLSATAYLSMVSNIDGTENFSLQDFATYNAAESGFLLGVRYMTRHDSAAFEGLAANSIYQIADWTDFDGYRVKVELRSVIPPTEYRVESWATLGSGTDTVVLLGRVVITSDESPPDSCVVRLFGWQDSLRLSN